MLICMLLVRRGGCRRGGPRAAPAPGAESAPACRNLFDGGRGGLRRGTGFIGSRESVKRHAGRGGALHGGSRRSSACRFPSPATGDVGGQAVRLQGRRVGAPW